MTYGCAEPIVPLAREGNRRKFSEADKCRIVEQALQPGASLSEVARRYGIAARVLFRWKQELMQEVGSHAVLVWGASYLGLAARELAPGRLMISKKLSLSARQRPI